MDPALIGFGLGVGMLVGMTGIGGGSLMTPLLILVFGVNPITAVGTDLAYAAVTKTVGGYKHWLQKTVDLRLSAWMAAGSVPSAIGGVYVLDLLQNAHGDAFDDMLLLFLATALLLSGVATLARSFMKRFHERERAGFAPRDAAQQLGYGRTYTMTVSARGPSGMPSRQTSSFTTLSPDYQAAVYLDTTAGTLIQDGGTYGIGTVVVARFDEPITDKAATELKLKVTTNPPVTGSWNWVDDQTAHWRPEKYYAPGTSVKVSAELYGTRLGDGLYGEQDEHVSFKIGDSHVSVADDTTKQVSVFDNGKLVRTMPTSMGMGGTETINGTTLSFWTPSGVYTVMDKANPVIMDSSTFGLPISSRLGYRETIPYATRISKDGIYLHQLNATVWAQGNTDTSHGCLNLNGDNAEWFFNFSVPGDVVEVRNTGGPPLQLWQNGDWTVPWDQWRQGSALNV